MDTLKDRNGILFVSPFYLLFLGFMVYPILFTFYLGFNKWKGIGDMEWVGLKNYINLLQDPVIWQAFGNAVFYLFTYVPIMLFVALVIAVLLNSKFIKGKPFFRAAVYLPNITAMIAAAFTFQLLLDKNFGLLNLILSHIGIDKINWLGTPFGAKISIDLVMIWRWLGYNAIIMLAGLQSIPQHLYEAAKIDGASPIKRFFKITIPLMKPVILFCVILSTIGTFKMFTEVFVMTQGGPANETITPVLYLYNMGFEAGNFGYAASIANILILITLILSVIQLRIGEDNS